MSDGPQGVDDELEGRDPEGEESRGRLHEVLKARRETLARLRSKGTEPFAHGFEPTANAAGLHERHGGLRAGADTGEQVAVAGRVVRLIEQVAHD